MTEINSNDSGSMQTVEILPLTASALPEESASDIPQTALIETPFTEASASPPLFGPPLWDAELQQLRIEIGALSGSPTTVFLTGWQKGLTVSLSINGELELRQNPFAPSLFPIEFFDQPLLQDWVISIPVEVRQRLQGYAINPLGFLMIINQDLAAFQLFLDHPLLFTLLYRQAQLKQQGLPWFLLHCRVKRRQLLKACGLPGFPWVVKLLRKLQLPRFNAQHAGLLEKLFKLDAAVLNHLPVISETLLRAIVRYPVLLSSRLLFHWRDEDASRLLASLDAIHDLRRQHFIAPSRWMGTFRKCRNVAEVLRLQARLAQGISADRMQAKELLLLNKFPPPPLAGNSTIQAITTLCELIREGQQLKHCIASYAEDIRLGDYYVYRVLQPERATLGIKLYPGRASRVTLVIDQLKGFNNQTVSSTTEIAVLAWFEAQVQKPGKKVVKSKYAAEVSHD